jgi:hypothetical protein
MEEVLYNSELVLLTFDKSKFLLELHWKKNTNPEEYRIMFNKAIECSKNNSIRYFLSDMRNEGLIRTSDMKWLEIEVLNRAVEHKLKKVALVFDDMIFSTVYAEVIKRKLQDSTIQVQFFSDINSARAWLSNEEK